MVHLIKIEKQYLESLIRGEKKCEIRLNDRDYQCGDWLQFQFEHNQHIFVVTHVHWGLGMADNYVALSVEPLQAKK
jgi:ASC-1-like (ASCH) protein